MANCEFLYTQVTRPIEALRWASHARWPCTLPSPRQSPRTCMHYACRRGAVLAPPRCPAGGEDRTGAAPRRVRAAVHSPTCGAPCGSRRLTRQRRQPCRCRLAAGGRLSRHVHGTSACCACRANASLTPSQEPGELITFEEVQEIAARR